MGMGMERIGEALRISVRRWGRQGERPGWDEVTGLQLTPTGAQLSCPPLTMTLGDGHLLAAGGQRGPERGSQQCLIYSTHYPSKVQCGPFLENRHRKIVTRKSSIVSFLCFSWKTL